MLLVVGWDAACFEVIERARASGRMPVLDGLLARGRAWQVRSTEPAVTFPAWTSFLTGAFPAVHGVTDFTIPTEDGYGVRFANSTHRRLPTIVAAMAEAGLRVGLYGIPATFPPEEKGVFEICGFDTPLGSSAADRATHPRELAVELRRRHGRLGIEGIGQSRITEGWHENARRRLLEDIALRSRISLELLSEHELDVFLVHFMEPDTAAHHFWQFEDSRSPRYRHGPRGVLGDVYAALDRSLGQLLEAAGPGADVLVLSDHGSAGASDRIVFWNRWLADRGWLGFHERRAEAPALRLKRLALGLLPPSLQSRAFALAGGLADRLESRARFAGIDWTRTQAFSDELPYFPSIRLNLAGRERDGVVPEADREAVLERLTHELLQARDPLDGQAVVEGVRRREEVFDGPFAHRYPDLLLDLRRPDGFFYTAASSRGGLEESWLRRLRPEESSGAKGATTSGVHAALGMAVAAGPRVGRGPGLQPGATSALPECTLPDLGVTVLAVAGAAAWPAMQGRSLVETGTLQGPGDPAAMPQAVSEYGAEEAQEVEERLRALGYLP